MSITFTFVQAQVENGETYFVHGSTCSHVCPDPSNCDDAATWGERSCGHADEARDLHGCESFDVHVNQANGAAILDRLDAAYEGCVGDMEPDDFLGRVLVMNVGRSDDGVAAAELPRAMREDGSPVGARQIDCGRSAGYFDEIASRLASLAVEAKARGVLVGWS